MTLPRWSAVARWLTAVLAALALAGCGSEPGLSSGAAEELHSGVDAVREAADAGDRDGALRALDELRARVDDADLAEADAVALRRGIRRARRRVEQEVAAPQPTPEATVEPTPEATAEPAPQGPPDDKEPKEDKKEKEEKKEKPDKGRGQGGGDEDSD